MLYRAIDPVELDSGCVDLSETVPFLWSSIPEHIVDDVNPDYKINMIEMTEDGKFNEKDMLLVEEVEELEDCDISFEWNNNIIGFEDDLL